VPVSAPEFTGQELVHGARDGIGIGVKPIVSEDEYLGLFDSNLPKLGIVAVWTKLVNGQTSDIDVNTLAWSLKMGAREFPALRIDEVLKRYYAGTGSRMVSVNADAAAHGNLERIIFAPGRVLAGSERKGFVFFRIDPALAKDWPRAGIVRCRNIRVSTGARITVEIALSDAHS
jgi:hypothetical protein